MVIRSWAFLWFCRNSFFSFEFVNVVVISWSSFVHLFSLILWLWFRIPPFDFDFMSAFSLAHQNPNLFVFIVLWLWYFSFVFPIVSSFLILIWTSACHPYDFLMIACCLPLLLPLPPRPCPPSHHPPPACLPAALCLPCVCFLPPNSCSELRRPWGWWWRGGGILRPDNGRRIPFLRDMYVSLTPHSLSAPRDRLWRAGCSSLSPQHTPHVTPFFLFILYLLPLTPHPFSLHYLQPLTDGAIFLLSFLQHTSHVTPYTSYPSPLTPFSPHISPNSIDGGLIFSPCHPITPHFTPLTPYTSSLTPFLPLIPPTSYFSPFTVFPSCSSCPLILILHLLLYSSSHSQFILLIFHSLISVHPPHS